MVLQGRKSSPQKSRPLESGHRRHGVWIAIEYSYKLNQKNEFKFLCELGWFLQRQSQIMNVYNTYIHTYMMDNYNIYNSTCTMVAKQYFISLRKDMWTQNRNSLKNLLIT